MNTEAEQNFAPAGSASANASDGGYMDTEAERKNMETEQTYEGAMARLEEIVNRLESGSKTLDEMLALYEEGAALGNFCTAKLNEYEGKLSKLTATLPQEEETI